MDYRNVKSSPADLEQMLVHSQGARRVPVIVETEMETATATAGQSTGKKPGRGAPRVTIGHGGT